MQEELPSDLYEAAASLAARRSIRINTLIQESISATIRADAERTRYEAYTLLGQDATACDVTYAAQAQAEVMLRDDC